MNRVIATALAATSLLSTGLMATDALAQNLTPPGVPEVFDWTGFYIGAIGGGAWGEFDGASSGGPGMMPPDPPPTPSGEIDYGDFNIEDESWLAGAQAGANRQSGNKVFGIVGDFMATDLEGSQSFEDEEGLEIYGDIAASLDWLATLRGLVGITSPTGRFLFYVTGGVAIGEIDAALGVNRELELPPPGADAGNSLLDEDDYDLFGEDEETTLGVALGAGIGAHLTQNLVLDASYLYVSLPEVEFEFELEDEFGMVAGGGKAEVDFSAHLGRLGLSFHF